MRIFYKKTAIDDLRETEQYIYQKLHNKNAALALTRRIVKAISQLSEQPYIGASLSSKLDLETDLRFLVVSKWLIFYRVNEDRIKVTRVLDGRQDYMTHLFNVEDQD